MLKSGKFASDSRQKRFLGKGNLTLSRQEPPFERFNDDDTESGSFPHLVARARAGDQQATGRLVENYREYLLFLANQDVEPSLKVKFAPSDAVQESMIRAQTHFDQFAGQTEAEFKGWLRTILSRDIQRVRRAFSTDKRNKAQEINLHEHSGVARALQDNHLTPRSDAEEQELRQTLIQAIARLSPHQRQVIELRNYEQLPFNRIGERMDRSEDAARKLWARAVETLKAHMDSLSRTAPNNSPPDSDRHE